VQALRQSRAPKGDQSSVYASALGCVFRGLGHVGSYLLSLWRLGVMDSPCSMGGVEAHMRIRSIFAHCATLALRARLCTTGPSERSAGLEERCGVPRPSPERRATESCGEIPLD